MGTGITVIFRMGTFWMLARGRVKWLIGESRQRRERSQEEKANEEGRDNRGGRGRTIGKEGLRNWESL